MATPPWIVVPLPLHVSWEEVIAVLMKSVPMAWSVERTTARIITLRQSRVMHVARVSQVICHTSLTLFSPSAVSRNKFWLSRGAKLRTFSEHYSIK